MGGVRIVGMKANCRFVVCRPKLWAGNKAKSHSLLTILALLTSFVWLCTSSELLKKKIKRTTLTEKKIHSGWIMCYEASSLNTVVGLLNFFHKSEWFLLPLITLVALKAKIIWVIKIYALAGRMIICRWKKGSPSFPNALCYLYCEWIAAQREHLAVHPAVEVESPSLGRWLCWWLWQWLRQVTEKLEAVLRKGTHWRLCVAGEKGDQGTCHPLQRVHSPDGWGFASSWDHGTQTAIYDRDHLSFTVLCLDIFEDLSLHVHSEGWLKTFKCGGENRNKCLLGLIWIQSKTGLFVFE